MPRAAGAARGRRLCAGLRRTGLGLLLSVLAALVLPPAGAICAGVDDGRPQRLETTPLVIETADGRRHAFLVELADNEDERRIGLMFRKGLAADGGMLFDYGTPQKVAMWMKNTLIPLDILFIRANGRIANIAHGRPLDLTTLPSRGRVLAALELAGGTAARLKIAPGDVVHHPIFGNWTPADETLVRKAFGPAHGATSGVPPARR